MTRVRTVGLAVVTLLIVVAAAVALGVGGLPGSGADGGEPNAADRPDTSFAVTQEANTFTGRQCSMTVTLTQVHLEHTGGAALNIDRVDVAVGDSTSTWGIETVRGPVGDDCKTNTQANDDLIQPVPDVFQTHGTNRLVEFDSGDRWNVLLKNGTPLEGLAPKDRWQVIYSEESDGIKAVQAFPGPDTYGLNDDRFQSLDSGDRIEVRWHPVSGGDPVVLTEYTVE
jgi:hypothetical protein